MIYVCFLKHFDAVFIPMELLSQYSTVFVIQLLSEYERILHSENLTH